MKKITIEDLKKAFEAGVNWKEWKHFIEIPYIGSDGFIQEPNFDSWYENYNKDSKLESKSVMFRKCDGCGEPLTKKSYPMYDENFKLQRGLLQCEKCYASSL